MDNNYNHPGKLGWVLGYGSSYIVFSAIFYFILRLFSRIPENWSFLNILLIFSLIILFSSGIQRFLR